MSRHLKKISQTFNQYKFIFIFGLCALVVLGAVFWKTGFVQVKKTNQISAGPHVIVLKQEGFSPSEITIRKGDKVTFTTALGKEFWPASNLHPNHSIYPDFDPKQ